MHHDPTTTPAVCLIGNHRHPGPGRVCQRHLIAIPAQLGGVCRMTRALPALLVPGSAPATGDKVTTSRTGSPSAARLDVLSLLAPGGAEVRRDARMLSPMVRRWSTLSYYDVTVDGDDGQPVTERRELRTWHTEVVAAGPARPLECSCGRPHLDAAGRPVTVARPRTVLADDQVGSIPPAEWLDTWVRRWRIVLGRTTSPVRGRVDLACDADQRHRLERARIAESLRAARRSPPLMPAVAQLIALQRVYQDYLATAGTRVKMALLGVRDDGPEHQARVAAALAGGRLHDAGDLEGATFAPVHDPIAAEWAVRYGYAGVAAAVEVDARRLGEWLPAAADHDDPAAVGLATFALELRQLHRELEHVLGETSDDQWIGRCPARLRDSAGDDTDRVCGAGLWQDPYRSMITCGSCHTGWPQAEWMHLAALIRTAWPIDRRRRYYQGDKTAAEKAIRTAAESSTRAYRCRGCEQILAVEWAETTRRSDVTRTWSPVKLVCPAGCIAGGTQVVAA